MSEAPEQDDVIELTQDELMERVEQRAEDKVSDILDSKDAPDWQEGEDAFVKMCKSIADNHSNAVDQNVRRGLDNAQRRIRDNGGQSYLEKAAQSVVRTNKADTEPSLPHTKGVPHFRSFTDEHAKGSGQIAAKFFWYAARSSDEGRAHTDYDWMAKQAKKIGDQQMERIFDKHLEAQKDLEASDFSQGGATIPTDVAEDIIPFLFGQTTFRQLGPTSVEIPHGGIELPRFDSAVSASWRSEGSAVNASTPDTGQVRLDENYLQIRVIFTREMLRNSAASIMDLVRQQMQREATVTEELSFLRGTGTGDEPEGIRNLVASGNQDIDRTQSSSTSDAAEIVGDLMGLQEAVYGNDSNVVEDRPAYVMQHRTMKGLGALTDADNNLTVLTDMIANREVFGAEVGVTSQLPENLDIDNSGSTDHTELYFCEMSEVLVGDGLNSEIRQATEATVTDGSGNNRNLFETASEALQLDHATDIALAHNTGAANLKNIDWGADILPVS